MEAITTLPVCVSRVSGGVGEEGSGACACLQGPLEPRTNSTSQRAPEPGRPRLQPPVELPLGWDSRSCLLVLEAGANAWALQLSPHPPREGHAQGPRQVYSHQNQDSWLDHRPSPKSCDAAVCLDQPCRLVGRLSSQAHGKSLSLLLTSCVILNKLLTLSVPLLSHVQNGVSEAPLSEVF